MPLLVPRGIGEGAVACGLAGLGLGMGSLLLYALLADVCGMARSCASTAAEEPVMARLPSTVSRLPAVAAMTASTATVMETFEMKGSRSWAA